jgi:membrane protein DedA with SNARE-associated domain
MRQTIFLFLGILIVGSPVLLPSIHLAIEGELNGGIVAALALTAMWASDSIWYALGRVGRVLQLKRLLRFGRVAQALRQVNALRRRVPMARLLFLSRFLYGTRIAANLLCGMVRTPYARVAAVNFASSLLWTALLFGLARSIGSTMELFLAEGQSIQLVVAVFVLAGFVLQFALTRAGRFVVKKLRPSESGAPAGARVWQVSVIVPAFNEQGYLAKAIRSVRRQRIPAEVVVVENGSTDATAEIAANLADLVVQEPERLGYSRARNLGAKAAHGDLLVFLDADSQMAPNALEAICRAATDAKSLGTVLGRPDRRELRYRIFFAFKNAWQLLGLYRGVLGGLLYCDAALFQEIGGFDEDMQIDELREFIRSANRAGGRYRIVTSTHSTTSMRRFEATGLARSLWFWTRLRLGVESGRSYWHSNFRAEAERKEAQAASLRAENRSGRPHPAGGQDARSSILGP